VQEEEVDFYQDLGDVSKESIDTDDYESDWKVRKVTEVQQECANPIYGLTYSFNSAN
jgi:hypothetical protein